MLELDPSVVSRAVAKLEQDTGLTLLERRGRGVVATDAGRLLAVFARRQQDLNDTFVAEVNNLKNAQRGHVELAFGEGFIDLVLEPVLQGFLHKHPDVTYNIRVAGTEETVRCILEDLAHIALFSSRRTTCGCARTIHGWRPFGCMCTRTIRWRASDGR